MKGYRQAASVAGVVGIAVALVGCGGLSGSSTCADYEKASYSEQERVMQDIDAARHGGNKFSVGETGAMMANANTQCPTNPSLELSQISDQP